MLLLSLDQVLNKILDLQQYWVILQEESFLSRGIGQISPRPKTCQCLPSPLLHNSHSDWSLEPQRWENIWVMSKRGHALSSTNTVSIHTWQTAALILGWLNWQGGCRETEMWCELGWDGTGKLQRQRNWVWCNKMIRQHRVKCKGVGKEKEGMWKERGVDNTCFPSEWERCFPTVSKKQ